ncbi:MAG: Uma2 family endonuclease [Thermodesulfovibrionales bacterium]
MKRGHKTKPLPYYTYDDYRQWEGNWELVEGIPYAMAPSPLFTHQYIITQLLIQIGQQIENCPEKCFVVTDLDWIISEDTVLRPDVVVICKEVKDYIKSPPEVIFEIVSKATVQKDEVLKFGIYQSEKVSFYVLIYPELKKARIFKLKNNKYEKIADCIDQNFEFETVCKFNVNFGRLWY